MRRSTIYDQGKEMAHHLALTENAGLRVYFAHPRSPWERDINENANGLLREYLSKGADLSHFAQQQFADIAYSLNGRPRKSLGWKSPAELFLPEGTFDFVEHYSGEINHVALGA